MYLILSSQDIEALSQFLFWLDEDAPTDASNIGFEGGRRLTVQELMEECGTFPFERIHDAWRRMHGIGRQPKPLVG